MSELNEELFKDAEEYIKTLFCGDSSGHDGYHSMRVHNNAVSISEKEGGDLKLIRLSSLLHDADDRKLFSTENHENARKFMASHGVSPDTAEKVCRIISQVSFKGKDSMVPDSLEGKIVQDADRLDAIGAIGIGRAFAYGGRNGRMMHDPSAMPGTLQSEDEYIRSESTTVNHFHEKLLHLKDMMNTETAKKIAEGRHRYLVEFLNEFLSEWDGKS